MRQHATYPAVMSLFIGKCRKDKKHLITPSKEEKETMPNRERTGFFCVQKKKKKKENQVFYYRLCLSQLLGKQAFELALIFPAIRELS